MSVINSTLNTKGFVRTLFYDDDMALDGDAYFAVLIMKQFNHPKGAEKYYTNYIPFVTREGAQTLARQQIKAMKPGLIKFGYIIRVRPRHDAVTTGGNNATDE